MTNWNQVSWNVQWITVFLVAPNMWVARAQIINTCSVTWARVYYSHHWSLVSNCANEGMWWWPDTHGVGVTKDWMDWRISWTLVRSEGALWHWIVVYVASHITVPHMREVRMTPFSEWDLNKEVFTRTWYFVAPRKVSMQPTIML